MRQCTLHSCHRSYYDNQMLHSVTDGAHATSLTVAPGNFHCFGNQLATLLAVCGVFCF